jgi:pyruvate-formate lyase
MLNEWNGFNDGVWTKKINVRNFIQKNYTLYEGDDSFLADVSQKTKKVWNKCEELLAEELKKGGVLDVETDIISGITNFAPGYIDKENEVIVGLQIDAPLKRIVNLYGGKRMAHQSLEQYGYKLNEEIDRHFNEYRKTHNEGVFDAYPKRTRLARTAGLLTGLPDAYGRGRIIGDYRRVALYGIDHLIEEKQKDLNFEDGPMTEDRIRLREEISEQIRALSKMKEMATSYGVDISKPAKNAKEAVQAVYMGYLAGTKENNGAATSLGRTSTFLDIYIERDLKNGVITETEVQELIDQFIIKLRLTRHLRTPEYDELFGGDPTWITESIGGVGINGKPLVTKNSFRYLHTLYNIGTAPGPNLTVLWSEKLPDNFKHFCSKVSIDTDSIQYENDDVLDFDKVWENYKKVMAYVAELYVDTVNIIHFMHDKYAYEASQFVLHDTNLERIAAYGIAGPSIAADSLSAIKYATVKPIRNENGVAIDFETIGDFPKYGNDDDRADALGKDQEQRVQNLTTILDGYFVQGAHHLNVNVMHRETLIDAMEHPEKYPTLTIRVSGYAVNFNRLSREQQEEVIRRTFHQSM